MPEAHFTVWTNLIDTARLKPGESVLIHGGSSGIGTAAIQLCAARGQTVFATAGSVEKCAACEALGARAINYRSEDFVEAVREATGGKGVDVILDMVGGDYIERNFHAAALGGRIVNIAFQSGFSATVNFAPDAEEAADARRHHAAPAQQSPRKARSATRCSARSGR